MMLQDDELYSGYDEGSNPLAVSCICGMLTAMHQLRTCHVMLYFSACRRTREVEDSRRCRRELVGKNNFSWFYLFSSLDGLESPPDDADPACCFLSYGSSPRDCDEVLHGSRNCSTGTPTWTRHGESLMQRALKRDIGDPAENPTLF